ncbi:uncharacterized protein IWZ02DRAFT_512278 [Phyllosticta citriasiana]|uniref:uncharacterized protein n=1 Tax=Phyllosticta citriasiana TaxID=595635 RepID=UPI0030FDBFCF
MAVFLPCRPLGIKNYMQARYLMNVACEVASLALATETRLAQMQQHCRILSNRPRRAFSKTVMCPLVQSHRFPPARDCRRPVTTNVKHNPSGFSVTSHLPTKPRNPGPGTPTNRPPGQQATLVRCAKRAPFGNRLSPYRCAFFSAKSAVCLPLLQLHTTACNQAQPRHSALPADRDNDAHNLAYDPQRTSSNTHHHQENIVIIVNEPG